MIDNGKIAYFISAVKNRPTIDIMQLNSYAHALQHRYLQCIFESFLLLLLLFCSVIIVVAAVIINNCTHTVQTNPVRICWRRFYVYVFMQNHKVQITIFHSGRCNKLRRGQQKKGKTFNFNWRKPADKHTSRIKKKNNKQQTSSKKAATKIASYLWFVWNTETNIYRVNRQEQLKHKIICNAFRVQV